MRNRRVAQIFSAVVLSAALSAACAPARGRVYVNVGPPPPIIEARLAAPGPGYVWIDGYQRWNGRGYYWVPGRWTAKPRAKAVWMKGHWEKGRKGWYYVDGRWR